MLFHWVKCLQVCCSVVSGCLWPQGLQQARLPCPSPTPRACPNPCPSPSSHLILCHPLLLLPSVFPRIKVFSNESVLCIRCQSIGPWASASVLPMNIQDWFPLQFGFPGGSEVKASASNAGDLGLIPGSGRSPGEGYGNPLQYSCLENPMDGGAWWATVHRVAQSDMTEWLNFQLFNFPLQLNGLIFMQFRDSQESSPTPQFKSISALALSFIYGPTLASIHDYWKNYSFD